VGLSLRVETTGRLDRTARVAFKIHEDGLEGAKI